ncbi:hypothetical protein NC653_038690 [Populus alba x Populus x berolinensis]|uniref:Uncharacterized protein n=1 Tax=Populus alba x Populus x berolinensis TaxID=444605 RepID=A0AAD6PUJ4_9ROSI|nr:hypothetical protein NC653_038690 [Populus alba x Populus x berolinensis]
MFALLLSLVKDKLRWPVETFSFSDGRSSEADAVQLSESFTLLWLPKLLCM